MPSSNSNSNSRTALVTNGGAGLRIRRIDLAMAWLSAAVLVGVLGFMSLMVSKIDGLDPSIRPAQIAGHVTRSTPLASMPGEPIPRCDDPSVEAMRSAWLGRDDDLGVSC